MKLARERIAAAVATVAAATVVVMAVVAVMVAAVAVAAATEIGTNAAVATTANHAGKRSAKVKKGKG